MLLGNLFVGIAALYATKLRLIIPPVFVKFIHNLIGTACFTFGMVALYYGYERKFMIRNSTPEAATFMAWLTIITLILSSVGALRSLIQQGRDSLKLLQRQRRPSDKEDLKSSSIA